MLVFFISKPVKFKALHTPIEDIDQPIKKGIDAIYENELFTGKTPPPKYIINEVKYNTDGSFKTPTNWKNKLSKTKDGLQMCDKWIEKNLNNMNLSRSQIRDMLTNSEKYLTGISKNGEAIEIFELSNNAKTIKTTKL